LSNALRFFFLKKVGTAHSKAQGCENR